MSTKMAKPLRQIIEGKSAAWLVDAEHPNPNTKRGHVRRYFGKDSDEAYGKALRAAHKLVKKHKQSGLPHHAIRDRYSIWSGGEQSSVHIDQY